MCSLLTTLTTALRYPNGPKGHSDASLQQLFGKVFADKGYISQKLAKQLLDSIGLQPITKFKRNMKNRLLPLADRLLRKRAMIETIIDQLRPLWGLKNIFHPGE